MDIVALKAGPDGLALSVSADSVEIEHIALVGEVLGVVDPAGFVDMVRPIHQANPGRPLIYTKAADQVRVFPHLDAASAPADIKIGVHTIGKRRWSGGSQILEVPRQSGIDAHSQLLQLNGTVAEAHRILDGAAAPQSEPVLVSAEPAGSNGRRQLPTGIGSPASLLHPSNSGPDWQYWNDAWQTPLDLARHDLHQEQFGDALRAMDLAEARAGFPLEVRTAARQFLSAVTKFFKAEANGVRQPVNFSCIINGVKALLPGNFSWIVTPNGVGALIDRYAVFKEGELNRLNAHLAGYSFTDDDPPLAVQLRKLRGRILVHDAEIPAVWLELPKNSP